MANIYDIAKEAGVSASTVSFVLNDKSEKMRIPEETQLRVKKTAKRLGYIPNVAAKKLGDRKADHIPEVALLWSPNQHSTFLNNFISTLNKLQNENKVRNMSINIIPFQEGALNKYEKTILSNHYNGIFVPPANSKDIAFLNATDYNIPVILLHGKAQNYCTVSVDNTKVGETAAELFYVRNHAHVGIVSYLNADAFSPAMERTNAFVNFCKRKNVKYTLFPVDSLSSSLSTISQEIKNIRIGNMIAEQIINSPDRPSAVFFNNEFWAVGAMDAMKNSTISVPDSLEVITYGNSAILEYFSPSITSIDYPSEKIIDSAICLMDEMLYTSSRGKAETLIDCDVFYRDSCPIR